MFAKYSVLAICLSFVSALDVSVPLAVQAGASVKLDVATVAGDPSNVGLLLCVSNGSFNVDLATNTTVAKTIEVYIPTDVSPNFDYFVAAIEVGNRGIIYSKSNLFKIKSA